MMRTSVLIGVRPPTRVYSPSCSTRSSRVCASSGMSPISSRNSVPPSACSNCPASRGLRAGERALLVPEQLALDQLARDGRHVHRDEWPGAPLAVVVQRASHQLLAGAALAGDHHGEVGVRQPRQDAVDLLHGGRAADQRQLLAAGLSSGERFALAVGATAPSRHCDHLVQVERLRQILVGARPRPPDRAVITVFCALITMTGSSGRVFLIAGRGRTHSRPASSRR